MATSRTRAIPMLLRSEVVPSHFISTQNVLVAFSFRCNLSCSFCMVEDSLGVKDGVSLEAFRRFAEDGEANREVTRVVLSGGEVTLDDGLLDYVAVARTIPTVRHVRLQTNGLRLASPKFVGKLREAGVDEFFISLHGGTPETCDRITRVEGSFRGILNGIATVARSGARLYTNTCITELNYRELPQLVELVGPHRPAGMDFWGLWPRLDLQDDRALHARVGDVRPYLVEALRRCEAAAINPVVKWFPRCLLGEYGRVQNDAQPTVLIQSEYWQAAPEFACLYESVCVHGRDNPCAGLSEAYVHRHGWEERLLRPEVAPDRAQVAPTTSPRAQPQGPAAIATAPARGTADRGASSPALDAFLERLGLPYGARFGRYTLRGATRSQDGVRLQLDDGEHGYTAFLHARLPKRPSFGETESLAIGYSRVDREHEREVVASVEQLLATLRPRDPGSLELPSA